MKKALVFGCNGQDGSFLMELLLEKNYEVHGAIRRTSQPSLDNIQQVVDKVKIYHADVTDSGSVHTAIEAVKPDEIYNLAGMSQVRWSFDVPSMTMDVNCLGLLRIIESVRSLRLDCKIYQACSSEMFGMVLETPQTESTPFNPQSPYAVSKAAAHYLGRMYREAYGMKIYCGILFNHESERRGIEFLSRKVCMGVAAIVNNKATKIVLGNLDAKRDWGYAKEYMLWVWSIVQHESPDDFILATGETHTVREFVEEAFKYVGITNWQEYIKFDETLVRPAEVDLLLGDASKSERLLGFSPKIKFHQLVKIMMQHELDKYE
jgi:GDPmannose 4,6-dehydratase